MLGKCFLKRINGKKDDVALDHKSVVATARDVTVQKQASVYARSLIEASLDLLVVIDIEGRIADVNEAAVNLIGVTRQRIIGTDFSEYFTDPVKAREGYQRVFEELNIKDFELTLHREDGTFVDLMYNGAVFRDSTGKVIGVVATARDVTVQKQAQAAIVAQRSQEIERIKEIEHLEELEKFQRLTIGRELQMIKMKKEIKRLTSLLPEGGVESTDEL